LSSKPGGEGCREREEREEREERVVAKIQFRVLPSRSPPGCPEEMSPLRGAKRMVIGGDLNAF
jgi:hypothetical protein